MAVRTNRDLYAHLIALEIDRDLETYLRALLAVGSRFADQFDPREPTPDEVVGMLAAAATAEPAEFDEAWLSRPRLPWDEQRRGDGRHAFEAILIGQVVDLRRMRDSGQLADDLRYFGLDAPGGGRWYNFDPASYLECGVAGSIIGGTDDDDEIELVTPPAPVDDDDEARRSFGWTGLCDLLLMGQIYE